MPPSPAVCLVILIVFGIGQSLRLTTRNALIMSDNSAKSFFFSQKGFHEIGVSHTLDGVISSLNLAKPSKIQSLSFSTIISGKHSIVADQTGSGKTLAYLLPIIQRMVDLMQNGTIPQSKSREPYIVVITPTMELANQVSNVAKAIANVLKFRTSCVTSASDMDSEQKKLRVGAHLVVATPGRLLALLTRDEISLQSAQALVLDEADVLFMDQSFPLQPIGAACPSSTQFIFTTATLPELVVDQIKLEFPDVAMLAGPGLHRIAPTIEEVLVDCSGPSSQLRKTPEMFFENKRLALLRSLETIAAQRTVIFCNSINQCRDVENALGRADRNGKLYSVYPYHGAIDAAARQESMSKFCRQLLQTPAILICTDRASRGMDFDRAPVDHVILFDFPKEPSEYVRRVGRTGRAGRFGRVTVLATGRQAAIAKQVMTATMQGKKIDPGVPEIRNRRSTAEEDEDEDDVVEV